MLNIFSTRGSLSHIPQVFYTRMLPICKDSLGWMFNKPEINSDLLLDQSELSTIQWNSFKDSKRFNKWCYYIQQPEGEGELERSREEKLGKEVKDNGKPELYCCLWQLKREEG